MTYRSKIRSKEHLEEISAACSNLRELIIKLGLSPNGGNYESVLKQARKLHVDISHLKRKPKNVKKIISELKRTRELTRLVKESLSASEILRKMGLSVKGRVINLLKVKLLNLGYNIDHFPSYGLIENTTKRVYKGIRKYSNEDVFVKNSVYSVNLRTRLLELGWVEKCSLCTISKWLKKPLVLHLDHINGDNTDNRLVNLRFLCPNCHSQTDTYCGKNFKIKNSFSLTEKEKQQLRDHFNTRVKKLGLKAKKTEKKYGFCKDCNKPVLKNSLRCIPCKGISSRKVLLPFNKLEKMVSKFGYEGTGRYAGVSGNTIKKTMVKYGFKPPKHFKTR